jgi:16S rRNA processing protein RimM
VGRELIEIGYVARAHGVKGELRVVTHDPASETLAGAGEVVIGGRRLPVTTARAVPGAWLLALEGVPDRNAAEALRGRPVEVDRDAVAVGEGEVILADLVGCRVELADGRPWGQVEGIEVGPQDRLVIHDGEVERLLPFAPAVVVEVDHHAGRVVVDPPEDWPESPIR